MLKLHVKLCIFCGRFNRQVMDSQDMCRDYKKQEDSVAAFRPKMDEQAKDQLKAFLASQSSRTKDND